MKKELKDKLVQDYPALFSSGATPECDDGWFDIIYGLCDILSSHIPYFFPEELAELVTVAQIKSKFGTLRFYMNHEDDYMNGAITFAEYQSGKTCERCGLAGTQRTISGWISVLCDKDAAQRQEEVTIKIKEYEDKYRK